MDVAVRYVNLRLEIDHSLGFVTRNTNATVMLEIFRKG